MISFCPDCGKNIQATFKFCPYCGNILPEEGHEGSQTFVKPLTSSFRGSRRQNNTSPETPSKKVKWSSSVTSPSSSLFSDGDSSGSEDTVRPTGSWSISSTPQSSPQTTKRSPQMTRQSPQTLKRSQVTASLEALPTRTVVTDKSGRQWILASFQTRDNQGILYEAESISTVACKSSQKQRFSLKLLDALEFLHENEYVHGNVTAENIFVNPEDLSQVMLAGYGFTFRYAPRGKHVAYVEGSRSPHEGDLEFISLDLHKGCGPSRRSDLQTLGYCLLKWLYGILPWTNCLPNIEDIMKLKEKFLDNPETLVGQCSRWMCPSGLSRDGDIWTTETLQEYMKVVMTLQYDEKPPYVMLRNNLKALLQDLRVSAYDPVDLQMVP
ncbi:serine/threonine-protein kinase VRK3 isoform X4 [Canis lupus baileyi]|uniref:inactive serine/threonine-protein kinase VRK3 isoform X8 n=1 Tax=Canis lupus dingo TaxID=286419 RepID=UPI000BAA039D|nr:inactive serine/threonine-protein kinase VRK3 isoform X8 [Canis lupus dingo]|eukprot:XP_022279257.1 inactive serine/threonine-protein kinase VRK3 isoform X5 [Canis lupus familiaris]